MKGKSHELHHISQTRFGHSEKAEIPLDRIRRPIPFAHSDGLRRMFFEIRHQGSDVP